MIIKLELQLDMDVRCETHEQVIALAKDLRVSVYRELSQCSLGKKVRRISVFTK